MLLDRLPMSGELATAGRLARELPGFLRNPQTLASARAAVRQRLAQREEIFLSVAQDLIYSRPDHPYRKLLDAAGCTEGDLRTLVAREGLEGALELLLKMGVYLSVEEFKGRVPVVRGSTTFKVSPAQLLNPRAVAVMPRASSGSRGARTLVPLDLKSIRDQAADMWVGFSGHGGGGWTFAVWDVPGGAAIDKVLSTSAFGHRPAKWFSQVDPASSELHARYRLSTQFLGVVSAASLRALPSPEYVPLSAPGAILTWVNEVLAAGGTPCIRTYASSAVRLAEFARERRQSLHGVQFSLGGEPITAARLAAIRAAGAQAHPTYGVMEAGPLGFGCAEPEAADDIHLFSDRLALIQTGSAEAADPRKSSLYLTSLLPTARVILLNAALGDRAVLERRSCGCPLEEVGWQTHIHSIRSFEKVTAGGMTFLDVDVIRVLEEVLPSALGGTAADYQLVEDEDAGGQAQLLLLIHPRVGPVDETKAAEVLLGGLGHGSGVERVMELAWREARFVRVERAAARSGATGKVLHFHQQRATFPVAAQPVGVAG